MYRIETSYDKPLVQSRHNTHMLAILMIMKADISILSKTFVPSLIAA